jgi:capsular exopolysaccharide synthesis family protein
VELRRSLRAVRRRAWLVVALPLLSATVALVITLMLPPVYQAQATVLVRPAQPINSLNDPNTVSTTADQVAATYSQLMTQRSLLQKVISDLKLKMTPDQLAGSVSVTPEINTTVLQVTVRHTNREVARDVANKLVDDFIAQTKDLQQSQVNQYTARIDSQVQQIRNQVQIEQAKIGQLQAQASPGHPLNPQDQATLSGLQQQVTVDRSQYFQIVSSESDIQINVARSMDNVLVVSAASTPTSPVSPIPWLNGTIAVLGGLIVAVSTALLLDHLDQSIKTDDELTERTSLIPLAHVPLAPPAWRGRDMLVVASKDPGAAEPYKTLRTNILFTTLDRQRSTIAVTSAMPKEGKSVVSANFAAALAAAGHRTVLLDCDFRRPSQHQIFGRIRNVGVSDLILGEVPDSDVILPADRVPGLWLVTSGRVPPNPSELLSSGRMRDLLQRLKESFTYVVIDTPPVNAVADPLIVASYVDATLFVVEQRRTTFTAVRSAVQSLERVGAHVAGAVVNKVVSPEAHYAYYRYGPSRDEPPAVGARREHATVTPEPRSWSP